MSVETMTKIDMDDLPLGQGIEEAQEASARTMALLEEMDARFPSLTEEERKSIRNLDMGGPCGWGGC